MPVPATTGLPVLEALPALRAALAAHAGAVLLAPPGTGKSTVVPLELLGEPWLAGRRIVMLEPRRLATRAVATRLAASLGEAPGATVGWRMRMDTRVGRATRLEVVTEGILTRQLQRDPALDGVGLLVFDEFHERNLQADLGLALAIESQRHLSPALRILVMSATLDGAVVARALGDVPVVTATGRSFPVETRYLARASDAPVAEQVAAAALRALAEHEGDVLAFLPGAGEIRRAAARLAEASLPAHTRVCPLYGDLAADEQDRAIAPSPPGARKVVLATNIAETSLTIEGIRVVVDGGLERRPRFDPALGMGRLETVRISRASADQRRGRAGRLGPGTCLRLWTEAQQRALQPQAPAEILEADLAPLALELACWGADDGRDLAWLDAPPAAALGQARELLRRLGALDAGGRITAHGRAMADLGAHPRLAHMLLVGRERGAAATACALAAVLSERDLLHAGPGDRDADLRTRVELLARDARGGADRGAVARVRRAAAFYARQLRVPEGDAPPDPALAGPLLAAAWPDRVARTREPGSGRYQLAGGRAAVFAGPQALARAEFLVIPELDAGDRDARIRLAAPLGRDDLDAVLGELVTVRERTAWDEREQAVVARRERVLGELVLEELRGGPPDPEAVRAALVAGLRDLGVGALPWTDASRDWQARVLFVRAHDARPAAPWPDVGDEALLATLGEWLGPFLDGMSRRDHVARLDLGEALRAQLTWDQQRRLDELAPTHLEVPSGSHIRIDYREGPVPALAVRLQEVFGLRETPRLCGGRVPVMMKLLSPAGRPVQVTQDLESFWARGYHEVRKELKGRYPKHYWPDDPWTAQPTRRVRPR